MLVKVNDGLVIETDGIKGIWSQKDQQGQDFPKSCVVSYGLFQIGVATHDPMEMLQLINESVNVSRNKMN